MDILVDVDIDAGVGALAGERFGPDAAALVRAAVRAAVAAGGRDLPPDGAEAAVLLTGDARVRELNRRWRGRDAATNVLAFPQVDWAAPDAPGLPLGPLHLGDIAVSLPTVAREADAAGRTPADHLAHMAVHGALHLLGHDHEADADAEVMEAAERAALAALGLSVPRHLA